MTKGSNKYQRRVASVIPQIVKSINTYMGCCKREYKPWVTKSFAFGVTANDLPNWIRARTTSANVMVASATPVIVAVFIWFTPESCEGESLHGLGGRVLRLTMIAVIDGISSDSREVPPMVAAVGNGALFRNGRDFASRLGLQAARIRRLFLFVRLSYW
jgi:hypothetical protein